MEFKELVVKCRTHRRFDQKPITEDELKGLVDLARNSACGGNIQPLKYFISCDSDSNSKIFPNTVWAGLLKDWPGPAEGERPTAYVVILKDNEVSKSCGCDHGIAAQSMVLGAMEKGIASCMIGSLKRDEIVKEFNIPERYDIMLVVAFGYPGERVIKEDSEDGNVAYYRDSDDNHHVPKRKLDDIILKF
ncbi:MAG: nitroreductase family protein [Planctomycetota bacterium]